ncbi:MAG TPA: nucleotidyltransferase family protein [Chryseolinea sp.]|nr:nucleotidyltransferase family protein [Chryseolinea sp.]
MAFTEDEADSDYHVDEHESRISIILLAAGSSSRMGQSKQLLEVNGTPLLLHSVRAALESGAKSVNVILGANEPAHREVIRNQPVSVISNHYWKSGMGSSIKAGLNHIVRKYSDTEAVIIMVCDQPAINAAHLHGLMSAYKTSRSPIVASAYASTAGVPALFSRAFFSNILMLKDEQGAKKIIEQFPEQLVSVDFPDGSLDLDTGEDYQNYLKRK